MPSYGLLGAIGGLGNALQTVGKSLEERRQQALAMAAKLAQEQRARADKLADKEEERDFTVQRDYYREDRQDRRTREGQEFRREERVESQTFRQGEREASEQFRAERQEDAQAFTNEQRLERQDWSKQHARFTSGLASARTREAIALRDKAEAPDVKGVIYGPVDANGTSEAIFYKKDGTFVPTGTRVQRFNPSSGGAEKPGKY